MFKLMSKYPGKWIALYSKESKRVVSFGNYPHEAFTRAQEKGIEHPFLVRVPLSFKSF
jgi:hypothetical protein